jgi:hypothetical protein
MDVASTSTAMLQANTKGDIGTAALKLALKSDQAAADLVSQAVETAKASSPPAGMGRVVDMTV